MARQYFLVKSEPYKYAWADLVRDGRAVWDGVRNFEARNNLRAMRPGDLLLYYHSNEGKEVVGIAEVSRPAYPDPTAPGEDWSVVEVTPFHPLSQAVTLEAIRKEPRLSTIALLRKSRLSVVPITPAEFDVVLELGATRLPGTRRGTARPKAQAKKPVKEAASRKQSQAGARQSHVSKRRDV